MRPVVIDKIASVTRACGLKREVRVADAIPCEEGVVVAVRVLNDKSTYNQVELPSGRMAQVKRGDVLAGALGHRKALFGYSGHLPERLAPFASQKAAGVFEGAYVQRMVEGREIKLTLAAGTWRLRGEFIGHERPMIKEPDFSNYVVERVLTEDGTEMPTERGGFLLQAEGEVRLRLVLRELADSEL